MNLLCRKAQEERWRRRRIKRKRGKEEMGERDEEGERERLSGREGSDDLVLGVELILVSDISKLGLQPCHSKILFFFLDF